jgi:hypothetical protein
MATAQPREDHPCNDTYRQCPLRICVHLGTVHRTDLAAWHSDVDRAQVSFFLGPVESVFGRIVLLLTLHSEVFARTIETLVGASRVRAALGMPYTAALIDRVVGHGVAMSTSVEITTGRLNRRAATPRAVRACLVGAL